MAVSSVSTLGENVERASYFLVISHSNPLLYRAVWPPRSSELSVHGLSSPFEARSARVNSPASQRELTFWPIAEYDGIRPAASWLTGLLAGYLTYCAVHYVVHHFGSGGHGLIGRRKRQHAVHHHGKGNYNSGVTTTLWDRLLGTLAAR